MLLLLRWLARAASYWRQHAASLIALTAVPTVIGLLTTTLMENLWPDLAASGGNLLDLSPAEHVGGLVSVPFVFASWAGTFIYLDSRCGDAGAPRSWSAALAAGFRNFGLFFAAHFLIGIAAIPLAVPGLVLRVLGLTAASYAAFGAGALVLAYLLGRWVLAFPLIALEGLGATEALRRSRELTRGAAVAAVALSLLVFTATYAAALALESLLVGGGVGVALGELLVTPLGYTAVHTAYRSLSDRCMSAGKGGDAP